MTDYEQRSDGYAAVEQYGGYTVYDNAGSKIGKVDDLFLDENDRPEYFGVKMGFFGTNSTLIPADIATVDESRGAIEVSQPKDTVKNGPAFDDDREITPEYENEVRSYYGLGPLAASGTASGGYADYSSETQSSGGTADYQGTAANSGKVGPGMSGGETGSGGGVGRGEGE